MLTAKKDLKFKRVSFLPSLRLPYADVHKMENIIKLLCVDEADKEYIVLITFSRKKEGFAQRAYAYLNEAYANQIEEYEIDFGKLRRAFILGIADEILFSAWNPKLHVNFRTIERQRVNVF